MVILPILVVLLLLLSAMLAASETALFALARMEHTRQRLSQPVRFAVNRLMRRPLESLVVAIGLNEASNVFAECLATIFFLTWLGPIGAYVAVPVMFVLVLLFCDITPKTFALGFPGGIARVTARPLALLTDMVHPVAQYLTPYKETPRPEPVSESEFKALLRLGENLGEVEPAERAMIHRVFEFGARRVTEVMTTRDRIFALDIETPPAEMIAQVIHGHFSRVPVYRGDSNNIIGILNAKDLAARRLDPTPPRIDRLVRPPFFVPPSKPLGELFDEMRHGRVWVALVVDEFGKLLGLVTVEDLLEELFGEIRDEFDLEGPELTPLGAGEWMASGGVEVKRLFEQVGDGNAPGGPAARTLSSLILRTLRRVPRAGESVRIGNFEVTAERVRGATVEQARIKRC
jgi:CBS domain containing-hemolysin-like protein